MFAIIAETGRSVISRVTANRLTQECGAFSG